MSFLRTIVDGRREAVAKLQGSIELLEARARDAAPAPSFGDALRAPGMSLIAEIKRRSPSKGELDASLDPRTLAKSYQAGGARAVSVLTEPDHFAGSPEDVLLVRDAVELPVLWKDFVLDRSQIVHARATGASAVLLIVRMLGGDLAALIDEARRWDLCPLVEIFNEDDLSRALDAGADVVGVNHRDLETFEEDPTATSRLRPSIPDGVVVVGESAISTRADVEALEAIGVDAILVGEALVRSGDPTAKIRELLGTA
jgi:indole-3-glycerol phosphate synthase